MRGMTVASVLLPALAFAAAPYMVTELTPGPEDGGADSLRAAGTRVVFRRFGGDLWRSDATAAGTGQLLSGATGNLTTRHDRVLFTIAAPPDEALWSTDGTSAGSAFVATVTGAESCQVLPEGTFCTTIFAAVDQLTPAGDLLFFRQNHFALWRSDGTTAGTLRIADFSTQVCSFGCMCCTQIGPDLDELAPVNEQLYFRGVGGLTGAVPLQVANVAGVTEVPASPFPLALRGVRGRLYIVADQGVGTALWTHDGGGTRAVTVLGDGTRPASRLTAAGGLLYFVLGEGTASAALWRSDGTAAGTFELLPSDAGALTAVGGRLFFRRLGAGIDELWHSDGTLAGTTMVSSLASSELTDVNGTLFFVASDGVAGAELWPSDGTPGGTTLVADLVPGPDGSAPAELTAACGRLYFTATTPAAGRELWALDLSPGTCPPVDETSCTTDPDCTDADACTEDACDAAAGCASTSIPLCTTTSTTTTTTTTTTLPPSPCSVVPLPDCQRPVHSGASKLRLKDRTADARDAVRWTWTKGQATSPDDLGDPRTTTGYALCLYDGAALRMTLRAPAGGICRGRPCWKAGRDGGFVYGDKDHASDGVQTVALEPDVDGKARARVVALGAGVPLPGLGALPFPVRVQLQGNGHCWEATFAAPRVHTASEIRATSD